MPVYLVIGSNDEPHVAAGAKFCREFWMWGLKHARCHYGLVKWQRAWDHKLGSSCGIEVSGARVRVFLCSRPLRGSCNLTAGRTQPYDTHHLPPESPYPTCKLCNASHLDIFPAIRETRNVSQVNIVITISCCKITPMFWVEFYVIFARQTILPFLSS
jgi:hypothetical protein